MTTPFEVDPSTKKDDQAAYDRVIRSSCRDLTADAATRITATAKDALTQEIDDLLETLQSLLLVTTATCIRVKPDEVRVLRGRRTEYERTLAALQAVTHVRAAMSKLR